MWKTLNYKEFCTQASRLRFLKKAASCCIRNHHSSCKQVINMSIYLNGYQLVHVHNYFLQCTNPLWPDKTGKAVAFYLYFIDIFEDGFYIHMCVCIYIYIYIYTYNSILIQQWDFLSWKLERNKEVEKKEKNRREQEQQKRRNII